MDIVALTLGLLSICLNLFVVALLTDTITINKKVEQKDKYADFRDPETGLLGRKKK